jgi:hypothetical protein
MQTSVKYYVAYAVQVGCRQHKEIKGKREEDRKRGKSGD